MPFDANHNDGEPIEMSSAEMKTLRESLGLSQEWLAKHFDVQTRTIHYWESSALRGPIPFDVANALTRLDAKIAALTAMVINRLGKEMADRGNPGTITLLRYHSEEELWRFRPDLKPWPATCHASMLNRIRIAAMALGYEVRIVYMVHTQEYCDWLLAQGREDSEENRLDWAISHIAWWPLERDAEYRRGHQAEELHNDNGINGTIKTEGHHE